MRSKKSRSALEREQRDLSWMNASPLPTPIAFFRFIDAVNKKTALESYSKALIGARAAAKDANESDVVNKLELTLSYYNEGKYSKHWQEWVTEKSVTSIVTEITETNTNVHKRLNNRVFEKDDVVQENEETINSEDDQEEGVESGVDKNSNDKRDDNDASDKAVAFDILEETMTVSSAAKAVTEIYLRQFDKYSVMDLRPQSKFSLSLDAGLQESILREVFEPIDELVTDDLHEFFTTFFNTDRGPQGWVDAVEEIVMHRDDSDIVKNAKKLLKETLPKFLKAFSLASINPLRDLTILEKPHLNQFVHPVIDAALYIFARVNYIFGEIPLRGLSIRADGVGFVNDVTDYAVVCGEGAKPSASLKKSLDDDTKNNKTMVALYNQVILSEADAGRHLFKDLRIYGWTAFKTTVSLTMLDFHGTYRLFKIDHYDLPKDWTDIPNFVFMYEAIIKWALCVRQTREGLIANRKKRRMGRYSEARIAKKLARLREREGI